MDATELSQLDIGTVVIWVTAGVAIMSEIIALVPSLKSNSVIQLLLNIGKRISGDKG